jgi:hypothetical protein
MSKPYLQRWGDTCFFRIAVPANLRPSFRHHNSPAIHEAFGAAITALGYGDMDTATSCNFGQCGYHAGNTMLANSMLGAFLYEILEVSPTARPTVIRAAYRCLAQEYHPDRNPGDAEAAARMALINHAYSVLVDPLQRLRYDENIGAHTTERRGRGPGSNPAKSDSGKDRPNLRSFAFRPLK